MNDIVYLLCLISSFICASLLFRKFKRTGTRILLWTALCFIGLAINNVLLLIDTYTPTEIVDLSLPRVITSLISVGLLLYGFIWELR